MSVLGRLRSSRHSRSLLEVIFSLILILSGLTLLFLSRDGQPDLLVSTKAPEVATEEPIATPRYLASSEDKVVVDTAQVKKIKARLSDIRDFRYLVSPEPCASGESGPFLLLLIHSAPPNFHERVAIRNTWASQHTFVSVNIKRLFLLGEYMGGYTPVEGFHRKLEQEIQLYNDILIGNFADTFRNLTYKFFMGMRWATERCESTQFILKVDDDVVVDIFQLVHLLQQEHLHSERLLLCLLISEGMQADRRPESQWYVDAKTYPYTSYPSFCKGLAYVLTADVAKEFERVTTRVPYFPIDDVMTGLLCIKTGVKPTALNDKYELALPKYRDWAHRKPKYIFSLYERNVALLYIVWNRLLEYYSEERIEYKYLKYTTVRVWYGPPSIKNNTNVGLAEENINY